MQVRVVEDELETEIRCAGWMAVKNDNASVDILAHAVAESELDDGLAMEEPARRARLGRDPEQHHVFHFGKYRNERYEDVTEESPDYYFWGSQERKPSKYFQHYLEWVTEHCVVEAAPHKKGKEGDSCSTRKEEEEPHLCFSVLYLTLLTLI